MTTLVTEELFPSSSFTTTFPDPVFAVPDALKSEEELQAEYTIITGKQLFPAQPETLLANWAAYLKTVVETNIQFTGEQCLVNFAINQNLDQLGTFWDAPRLGAEPAIVTLEFRVDAVKTTNTFVPEGTRVRTSDRNFIFATNDTFFIPSGELSGSILATATTSGIGGNGYAPDTITELIDPVFDIDSVSNTTNSSSGRDTETDDEYRARLLEAPNKITVAGSIDQYKFIAKSVDGDITDVAIESPTGAKRRLEVEAAGLQLSQDILDYLKTQLVDVGNITAKDLAPFTYQYIQIPRYTVDIYILTALGQPSTDLITKVQDFFNQPETRPLTDVPRVFAPITQEQQITVNVTILQTADSTTIQERLENALADYVNEITSVMGVDIVPAQIIDRLSITGETYDIEVLQPPAIVPIAFNEFPTIVATTINIIDEVEG